MHVYNHFAGIFLIYFGLAIGISRGLHGRKNKRKGSRRCCDRCEVIFASHFSNTGDYCDFCWESQKTSDVSPAPTEPAAVVKPYPHGAIA